MEKDYALVILAAGIGSRYGGIKQLEAVGPHGEVIMDYSVRDSISAGFTKIIFVLRNDIEKDFWEIIGNRIKKQYAADGIEITSVLQNTDDLPTGYTCPPDRIKPWGTCHALLACREAIDCPFAIINADDYYGTSSFVSIIQFLQSLPEHSKGQYCMAGFKLDNTLSPYGGVTRGICTVDEDDYVRRVNETRGIIQAEDGSIVGDGRTIDRNCVVSMNMWGYTPDIIETIHERFCRFLDENINNLTAEYLLPDLMDELLQEGLVSLRQLPTQEKWYGITYKEDISHVRDALQVIADN